MILYQNVATGLVVYPQVIAKHLREELPFMATENILMAAVAAGGDRQTLHERIRQHSQAAAAVVKEQGGANDLIARLKADKAFAGVDVDAAIDPAKLTGRSKEQVDEFLSEIVEPIRKTIWQIGSVANPASWAAPRAAIRFEFESKRDGLGGLA